MFPVIISMDGDIILCAPFFYRQAAGSLILEKEDPFGKFCLV